MVLSYSELRQKDHDKELALMNQHAFHSPLPSCVCLIHKSEGIVHPKTKGFAAIYRPI